MWRTFRQARTFGAGVKAPRRKAPGGLPLLGFGGLVAEFSLRFPGLSALGEGGWSGFFHPSRGLV